MNFEEIAQFFKLPSPIQVSTLTGGANNRVYKLEFYKQNPVVLKHYFQHCNDLRPRLQSEFSFLQYAWKSGIQNVPEPIASSIEMNAAIYSYIPGRAIQISDISDELIKEMISFFKSLNQNKSKGIQLPPASESCFSINDYLQITERRLARLQNVKIESSLGKEFSEFLHKHLFPEWIRVKESTCKAALHSLLYEDRCISPSDFGFHNALIENSKKIFFIDFEYAGWDDPCKTVCDLFCQPRIPIPYRYFLQIAQAISSITAHPENCFRRIQVILPVMQIKWCCILLNTFTQVGENRRIFSNSDEIIHKENQLRKARELLLKNQEF